MGKKSYFILLTIAPPPSTNTSMIGRKPPAHGLGWGEQTRMEWNSIFQLFRRLLAVLTDLECWQNWHILDIWGPLKAGESGNVCLQCHRPAQLCTVRRRHPTWSSNRRERRRKCEFNISATQSFGRGAGISPHLVLTGSQHTLDAWKSLRTKEKVTPGCSTGEPTVPQSFREPQDLQLGFGEGLPCKKTGRGGFFING